MDVSTNKRLLREITGLIRENCGSAAANLAWLQEQMHPYFFSAMQGEQGALAALATGLQSLGDNRRLILADREKSLILACLNAPGSLYDTLRTLPERDISFAYFAHSAAPVPSLSRELEIQRFEFDRKGNHEIAAAGEPEVPAQIRRNVLRELKKEYPAFPFRELDRLLGIVWLNNESYVRISPPRRIAQLLWLFAQGNAGGGLYLDVEETNGLGESRVLFAVA
ncbi:MAG TPA: amino acid dehydrogenase, partial [Geobacteraceae bacterium]